MDKLIRLRLDRRAGPRGEGLWVADHYVDNMVPDPHIIDLFGTHTLPLPCTGLVKGKDVLAQQEHIAQRRKLDVRFELVTT